MKKRINIAVALVAVMTMGSAQAQYSETNNLFYHTFRTPQRLIVSYGSTD